MKDTIFMLNQYAVQPQYGGGRRYHDWAKYLIQKGYNVYIICSGTFHKSNTQMLSENEDYKIIEDEGVKYTYVKTSLYSGNGLKRIRNMIDYYYSVKKTSHILPRPIAIIARSPNPLACVAGIHLAKKYSSVIISDIVDLWPESIVVYKKVSRNNPLIKLLYLGEKWIYKNSTALIFSMAGGYKYIEKNNWNNVIPKNKVFHINTGVDIKQFDENAKLYSYDVEHLENSNIFKVSYCGSVSLVNNLKLVCDAGKILLDKGYNDIFLMIHGSGDQVEELSNYCQKNEIRNVKFYGYIEKNIYHLF